MTAIAPEIDSMTLSITEETHVRAPIAATFAALLEEMGPSNEGRSRHGRAAAGSATSVMATDTCGVTCRRSSGRRCSRLPDR